MPDWSYRTVLRPLLMALGAERARRLATRTLATLARVPLGTATIDFLGHMRSDPRLRTRGSIIAPSAIGPASSIPPAPLLRAPRSARCPRRESRDLGGRGAQ